MSLLNEAEIWEAFGDFRRKAGKRDVFCPTFFPAWLMVAGNRGLFGGTEDVGRERARVMYRKHAEANMIEDSAMKETIELVESIYDA